MTCCAVEYCALLAGKEVRTQVCCSDLSMLPVQGCCMVSPASARLFSKHVLHLQDDLVLLLFSLLSSDNTAYNREVCIGFFLLPDGLAAPAETDGARQARCWPPCTF
eukprot:scaffold16247_cov18-Tisochrysis_lutea.AAC.2